MPTADPLVTINITMKKVSIYSYYSFGFNYYLTLRDSEDRTNENYFEWLKVYLDRVENLNLQVTQSAMHLKDLQEDVDKLEILTEDKDKKSDIIDKKLHNSINKKLKEIDLVLDSELRLISAYELEDKRVANETLLGNVHKLLPKDYFSLVNSIAQYDLNESGYCLAFNRYTASAFHSLRAMEDVLKMYFEKITTKTATEKDTWGSFVVGIKNLISKKNTISRAF